MQTFKDKNSDWTLFYNSDLSGDVTIYNNNSGEEMNIPGSVLFNFAKFIVASDIISFIEKKYM